MDQVKTFAQRMLPISDFGILVGKGKKEKEK